MSLVDVERRSKRTPRKHTTKRKNKHRSAPAFLLREGELHDEQVLSFAQWCALNGFSPRTGRRLLASGNGPIVTQLSEKRMGITVRNNRRWQEARAR
jgi:hypothetical protein